MRKTQHDVNMSTLHDFKDELWFEICGVLGWLCEKYNITPPAIAMREKNEWDRYMKVHGEDADMDKFEELYKKNTVMVNELEDQYWVEAIPEPKENRLTTDYQTTEEPIFQNFCWEDPLDDMTDSGDEYDITEK